MLKTRSGCWRWTGTMLLMLAPFVFGCERPLGGGHYDAPLVRLLANPSEFDSKRVLTAGYLWFGFSGPTLYLSEADAVHGITRNGVAIVFSESVTDDEDLRARVDGKYVMVTGLFEDLGTGDTILKDVDNPMVYSRKDDEKKYVGRRERAAPPPTP